MSPELQSALLVLVVLVTAVIQSWFQRWKDQKDKVEVKQETQAAAAEVKAEAKEAAAVVAEKVDTVHKAINGEGLGGKLDQLAAWAKAHDDQDNRRYDELVAKILSLKRPPDARE